MMYYPFISRCGHLWCESRRSDCILQVFTMQAIYKVDCFGSSYKAECFALFGVFSTAVISAFWSSMSVGCSIRDQNAPITAVEGLPITAEHSALPRWTNTTFLTIFWSSQSTVQWEFMKGNCFYIVKGWIAKAANKLSTNFSQSRDS